ncbi:2'-5' RNA ligase family protein [Amycolatopsis pigmentata]|uniref:RNA 2',3'-cyclic phosphodiesterase n=1 Tax=Amycolatopsis pigmentata TaxID=450801 RepID=A0ABW5G7H5_9PSEU
MNDTVSMLLFSALFPPAAIVESLRAELSGVSGPGSPDGVRWADPATWHVTLGFYAGDDDPSTRAKWLRDQLAGRPAPTLRLEGAGSFAHVLYLGVYGEGLTELAMAAGAGADRPYLPHLTVARTRNEVPPELPRRLSGYASDSWTAEEVVLVRSDRTAGEDSGPSKYSVVERFALPSGRGGPGGD